MYAIVHDNIAYGPNGQIKDVEGTPLEAKDADAYNKEVERQEIDWLKTAPDKVFLYVRMPEAHYEIEYDHNGVYVGHIEQNHFKTKQDCEKEIESRINAGKLKRYDSRGFNVRYFASRVQPMTGTKVHSWLGGFETPCHVGSRQVMGFQGHYRGGSYRRSVECRIFGVRYVGWFMESSGDYCRLRKAKVQ